MGTIDYLKLYRLQSFPAPLLKKLKTTDEHFLDNFGTEFPKIIRDIKDAE